MKSLITTLLTIGLIAPQVTYANITISNNGSVSSYTSSSANSGGQSASSGENVTTGDASASAYSETHVSSDSESGNVHVKVETNENGAVKTQEYSNSTPTNTPVKVEIRASSHNGEATSSIRVNGSDVGHEVTPQEFKETSPRATTTTQESVRIFFSIKIPSIFKKVFSFFWRF